MAAATVVMAPTAAAAEPEITSFDASGEATHPRAINSSGVITGHSGGTGFVRAVDGTITSFSVDGAAATIPWDLNDADTVTGNYHDATNRSHGFVRTADGTITSFDIPGLSDIRPTGINNAGVISGDYQDAATGAVGMFVRAADGTVTTFQLTGSHLQTARAINSSGDIAGDHEDVDGFHGFVRQADGTVTSFDLPDAQWVSANEINDSGTVAGSYWDDPFAETDGRGFVRDPDGTITTFVVTGATNTITGGVNNSGVITGRYEDADGHHGFERAADGTITTFDIPGAEEMHAQAINGSGVIVGNYVDAAGIHGFVRAADTTVPNQIALIAGNANPPSGDRRLVSHLEADGYSVVVIDDDALTPESLASSEIAIVSSSVVPGKVPAWLAQANIPLMTSEAYSFEALALASKGRETPSTDLTIRINNANAASPLANGLTFRPQVFSTPPGAINFGLPGDEAIIIGTEATGSRRPIHFAYEADSMLVDGSTTPARRVATFSIYDGQQHLNGTGYGLVDAAIEWLFD